ncbi:MAG: nickel pincer cofactor biosynthesis protein LarB [Candidatus Methanoplasma sp.]|jgi:NCAIR mutase (PurE)-related protein|nr:nickel pincer cofactor biosynthesis protein LarB [Candidatus Methanoplasma sp.]
MNNPSKRDEILAILRQVESGAVSADTALERLRFEPFEDLGYAKIDHHRTLRQGIGEVIYGQDKTPEQIAGILSSMREHGAHNVLITRISGETADLIAEMGIILEYHPIPRLGIAFPGRAARVGNIVVASGGTSDMAVCEETALTAETLGNNVVRIYDVGVAGLHRLLAHMEELTSARVIVAVAGMEGALAGVIGGLVSCPVIAVPTSIGYGANFGGLSALLSMLNTCACGVSVVNIDNGFGAGILASRINQMDGAA